MMIWAPFGLLVLASAGLGLRWGWIALNTSETDVISRYAARYVAQTGGPITDCRALPGEDQGIWLVVICGPTPVDLTRHYEYHVNRLGGLEYSGGPFTWGVTPAPLGLPALGEDEA